MPVSADSLVLATLAVGFAWSMGAHYTGACMGMPYATGAVGVRPALATMAVFVLVGASLLSHGVLHTVGERLLGAGMGLRAGSAMLGAAFALTALYNRLKLPTSTIQILVSAMVGAGLAQHIGVKWATLARLVAVWAVAPFAALALGFVFTRILDRVLLAGGSRQTARRLLVLAGCFASLTMGANDVANATGVLVATRLSGCAMAGVLGGCGLALGVITWGRGLLERMAFEIVRLDLQMAAAAQFVQALVVLSAVLGFGAFTSMNQALVGAMAGAGLARGVETVRWSTLRAILEGWVAGPLSGLVLAYLLTAALRVVGWV